MSLVRKSKAASDDSPEISAEEMAKLRAERLKLSAQSAEISDLKWQKEATVTRNISGHGNKDWAYKLVALADAGMREEGDYAVRLAREVVGKYRQPTIEENMEEAA